MRDGPPGRLGRVSVPDSDSSETESDEDAEIRPLRHALAPAGIRARPMGANARAGVMFPTAPGEEAVVLSLSEEIPPDAHEGLQELLVLASGAEIAEPYEQLWSIVVDEPFPAHHVDSFPSFIHALNGSSYSSTPVTAHDWSALLRELIDRDHSILLRAAEASNRRIRGGRSSGPLRPRSPLDVHAWSRRHGAGPADADAAAGTDDSPLREGIWRTSFVEHLDDGTARDVEVDLDAFPGTGESFSFADFAQQRRAERREGAGVGGDDDEDVLPASRRLEEFLATVPRIAAPASAASNTPAITMTSASTPATSAAQTPPASASGNNACPARAPVAAAPRTSASIAEAHFRSHRRVVPLRGPSPSATATGGTGSRLGVDAHDALFADAEGDNGGLRAVVEALQRARTRPGGTRAAWLDAAAARVAGQSGAADLLAAVDMTWPEVGWR